VLCTGHRSWTEFWRKSDHPGASCNHEITYSGLW
jgi:hypothetical protein